MHLCLVKADAVFEDQDTATSLAEEHLAAARQAQLGEGGTPQDFALSLRHEGYHNVLDFRLVTSEA